MPPCPTRSGKPCLAVSLWRVGPGEPAGPGTGLPRRGHPAPGVTPQCWPGRERWGRAGALGVCTCRSPRTHLGVGFVRVCTCTIAGVQGQADLRPRRPGESWGRLGGQQGGGFPGALWPYRCGPRDPGAPPRLCVLGLVGAGTPGLGQAQKSPFPDQAPNGGSGDRGGCVEPVVTAGSGASISRRAPSAPGATTGSCTLRGWALQRDGPRQVVGSSIRARICQCSERLN